MPSVRATMHEFKHGALHSGSKSGPVVRNRKQAIAIALSEERKKKGEPAGELEGAEDTREIDAMHDQVARRTKRIRSGRRR